MTNFQSRNIIVGAASTYISNETSLSSTWPAATVPAGTSGHSVTDALDVSTDWRTTGYTMGGVEFAYTPTYGEVTVDQLLDAAKLFKSKMTATVKTTLEEATLENLLVSWAQDPTGGNGQPQTLYNGPTTSPYTPVTGFDGASLAEGEAQAGIAAGALGIEPVERQMVFVGPAPRVTTHTQANAKLERVYHLRRVISVTASTHSLKRDNATEFPVEFRLLPGNVSGAEYGTIRNRVLS